MVPSIKYDLAQPVKPWAYFCQISDSTTSPMFVIESDATLVTPLILSALLECRRRPTEARALLRDHAF